MSDRIELQLPSYQRVSGDALMVSDAHTIDGGDTLRVNFPIPEGVERMDVVAVLVRLDRGETGRA